MRIIKAFNSQFLIEQNATSDPCSFFDLPNIPPGTAGWIGDATLRIVFDLAGGITFNWDNGTSNTPNTPGVNGILNQSEQDVEHDKVPPGWNGNTIIKTSILKTPSSLEQVIDIAVIKLPPLARKLVIKVFLLM